MPTYNAVAFAFDVLIAVGIALAICGVIRTSLRQLLNNVITIPDGVDFYLRMLALILICVCLGKVLTGIHQKPEAHFLEYVWAVASDISGVFENLFIALLVYLGLITVLVAVLRPNNEK
ncbi:MAG: hypothetical protein ACRD5M_02110 [Candidatus Acidiferrales bacterium]